MEGQIDSGFKVRMAEKEKIDVCSILDIISKEGPNFLEAIVD